MNTSQLNIVWYVLCWNEMPILPFMIDYWKCIATKVIVYDNNSTDGSIEYLKNFDWIEVRQYPISTNNQLNDDINRTIKNTCWHEQKGKNVDFVIVTDLDEILWSANLIDQLLEIKNNDEITIVTPLGFDFISETFPIHNSSILLHEQIQTCIKNDMWNKPILFKPDNIESLTYCPGAHAIEDCNIIKGTLCYVSNIYLLHFKYLSREYLIMKRFATKDRMSTINIENNWGYEYLFNKDQIIDQFNRKWYNAKYYTEYMLNI